MELWDILDIDRNKTKRLHEQGKEMKKGDYHLVVHIWIINSEGKILITQRTPNKDYPLHWETTGGYAIKGDTSIMAALREVKEEMGLKLDVKRGFLLSSTTIWPDHLDAWVFYQDFDINDIKFQEGETCDAKWATIDKIKSIVKQNNFVPLWAYVKKVFELAEKERRKKCLK